MKLEQKEPTRDYMNRTRDVMKALLTLNWMDRFPDSEDSLVRISRVIARFCQTVEVNDHDPDDPEWNRKYGLGWVVPLDYMIEQAAATFTRFPAPIQFRRLYEAKFTPLDGKSANDLESVANGRE